MPLRTLNNCAHGVTPWGTYLTCEENFNGYFGTEVALFETEERSRYRFSRGGFGYGWYVFDARFDLGREDYRHEENRFDWVVKIDPMNPWKPPA